MQRLDALQAELGHSKKLSPTERAVLINKLNYMRIYIGHLNDVTITKQTFWGMVNGVAPGQCVITIDYKEKPKIGSKSDEESWVFRQQKLRNCLGFAFDFEGERIYVGAMTNISNQTGLLSNSLIHGVIQHPLIQQKFKEYKIRQVDWWFDRGSHFSNKMTLKWALDIFPRDICADIERSNVHYHIAKHGKTHVDGIFGSYSNWLADYSTFNKAGVQTSADICAALEWGVQHRCQPSENINYLFLNMDIDGPYKDDECMQQIKCALNEENYVMDALILSQLKAFNHYFFDKQLQQSGIETEREIVDDDDDDEIEQQILTLPSLNQHKMKNIDKILIRTKALWTDNEFISRWHQTKTVIATKPKIASNVLYQEPNIKEVERQQTARKDMFEKQELYKGKSVMIDVEMNMDPNDNATDIDMGKLRRNDADEHYLSHLDGEEESVRQA